MRIVKTCSAPCGSGKTFQIASLMCTQAQQGNNTLLVQPTKELIRKTIRDEINKHYDAPLIKEFHEDAVGKHVAQKLAEYLANPEDRPQIVIATQQVLSMLPYFPTASSWELIFDELPQVDRDAVHNVPDTHRYLTDYVSVRQYDSIYSEVIVEDKTALQHHVRTNDDLLKELRETAGILLNTHYRSFVHSESYANLVSGMTSQLSVHSLLMPTVIAGYPSVLLSGANFEDSGVRFLWEKAGVKFVEDTSVTTKLRYRTHPNGDLVDVYYATERDWTRALSDVESAGLINLERLRYAAVKTLSPPYLWQANVRVPDKFLPGQRLPNSPHGLNMFGSIHQIGFFSALNKSPAHANFLKHHGLTEQEIARMGTCSAMYQSIMRTSLRDPNNSDRKVVVVPDRRAADFIAEKLPGATIHKLDAGIVEEKKSGGRRPLHADNAAKSRAYRARQKAGQIQKLANGGKQPGTHDCLEVGCISSKEPKHRIDITLIISSDNVTQVPYECTIYKHKKSSLPLGYLMHQGPEAFVEFLREHHAAIHENKDDNSLFSPAIFDPYIGKIGAKGQPERRAVGNILCVHNIVFDFENGDLRPEEVPQLFPGLQMVVVNSYMHTSAMPRFRVILLTEGVMSPSEYKVIFDAVAAKLHDAGYRRNPRLGSSQRRSGLDYGKRSPASLFYLPCQARTQADSFFYVSLGGHRELLKPQVWLQNVRAKSVGDETAVGPSSHIDQNCVDTATALWRSATKGEGNIAFFRFALDLGRAGLTDGQLKSALVLEAQNGHSPSERLAQIPSIMKSMKRTRG
jgi:hypothetical protein